MTLRIYSDPHFGHHSVIAMEKRPFGSVNSMDKGLIRMWNEVVKEDDITIVCGDVQISRRPLIYKILNQLNGKIIIVPGNHDDYLIKNYAFWSIMGEIDRTKIIITDHQYVLENAWNGHDILFCHFPLEKWDGQYNKKPTIHMHGHSHVNYRNDHDGDPIPKRVMRNRYNITMGYLANVSMLPEDLHWRPITIDQAMEAFEPLTQYFASL